ncbi:N-terminal double-transmembrane domain-containing protein [Epibacterium ulvae]|uniref:N-terminal double-transmembrane domain-containing protein n=1 Tax=Epibacterium ulvae TaxID=1156985 RepID=A0A1G5QVM8_9RHOB|nr:DUF4159 domain-containing protein [Epibacterium ulvae]SCZ65797.1 N-terminal double-transmembrane domain-containing protein [Epibacterium ulvae]
MTVLAGIGFSAPWLLLGLLALPVLWFLLRAVPPAPRLQQFPAVTLLVGLTDEESQSDRTPWWLLLLRLLLVAAAIIGLAGPVLNPNTADTGRGPLVIILDASWAGAGHWPRLQNQIETDLQAAHRAERPVAVLSLTKPDALQFQSADTWQQQIPGLRPQAWRANTTHLSQARSALENVETDFDTLWYSDGLASEAEAIILPLLETRGTVEVIEPPTPIMALNPVTFQDGTLHITAQRNHAGLEQTVALQAMGLDPSGTLRALSTTPLTFDAEAKTAEIDLSLPAELSARVQWYGLQGVRSAGAVALSDDSLRRREVALISAQSGNEGLALLSPLHYLRNALIESTDLLEGPLADLLPAQPDAIVLADIAHLPATQETALIAWVEEGGTLLRFAGPRLAASDTARTEEHPLMPVRLRAGGRSVGGAMSWGAPKTLAPFPDRSPFYGLDIPAEVEVRSQVVAQPEPRLAERVIAELSDGTPLVTRKSLGAGQVILFHVTANAEWSSLPLSGLFVEMLERLAISSGVGQPDARDLEGTTWAPVQVLDGFGTLGEAGRLAGVAGTALLTDPLSEALQPGLYQSEGRAIARNVLTIDETLTPPIWPANVTLRGFASAAETVLSGYFLALALVLLAADIIATLGVSGLLRLSRTAAAGVIFITAIGLPHSVDAQDANPQTSAAAEVTLAYVETGDAELDRLSEAGLHGLSLTLSFRTSVEPANPQGVNLDQDELAFYPLLYWPVSPNQATPSAAAYEKLNAYLQSGGMILFDTRDADISTAGANSPATRRLQQLARPLDIPPLEPVPQDHVLTRTFYLLQDFPGRQRGAPVWVEAAPNDAEQIEGLPFRNLNDGVSPVVIGGNDWASAWAMSDFGTPLYPVGRGFAGERQREMAFRFGVNLVMHILTGNYKSDQVHVPALLDRLGQ